MGAAAVTTGDRVCCTVSYLVGSCALPASYILSTCGLGVPLLSIIKALLYFYSIIKKPSLIEISLYY